MISPSSKYRIIEELLAKLQRYDLTSASGYCEDGDIRPLADGDYVRYEDIQDALYKLVDESDRDR